MGIDRGRQGQSPEELGDVEVLHIYQKIGESDSVEKKQ